MPKPRRAASPAYSENEVDIAGSLFANDADSDSDNGRDVDNGKKTAATADALDFGDLLNAADGDSDDADGDAAFIARQQRSSNRKTGNLQSKSAKKGGGFQVMGESLLYRPLPLNCSHKLTPRVQASMRTSSEPSIGRASPSPPRSSAKRSP